MLKEGNRPSTILNDRPLNENGIKKKVLFVCTHNSARSQMAEGLLKTFYGDRYEPFSAGTKPSHVSPYAIMVMQEIGIDISSHSSKSLDDMANIEFDYVVTVCDSAKEECPFFPGNCEHFHQSFEDPSAFMGMEEEKSALFRKIRNEIKDWLDFKFGCS